LHCIFDKGDHPAPVKCSRIVAVSGECSVYFVVVVVVVVAVVVVAVVSKLSIRIEARDSELIIEEA